MSGHKSNPLYVVTATTRRVWSAEEKRTMVAEAAEPGATVPMVARRHAIHSSLLFRWRRDAQAGARAVPPSSPPTFVPLALPGAVEPPQPASASGTIEIDVAGGHRLRVEGTVDPTMLRSVIEALVGR